MRIEVDGFMTASRAGGESAQVMIAFEICPRSHGPNVEATTAVGAYVAQDAFNTSATESAFEGADARLRGVGRQLRIAVLAVGTEFKHGAVAKCADT